MNTETRRLLRGVVTEYNVQAFLRIIPKLTETEQNSALYDIVKKDYFPFVEALGKAGVDFSFMNCRCISVAVENGSCDMIRALCFHGGCDPDSQGGMLLRKAASVGWAQGVDCLFDCGASPAIDRGRAFLESCIRNYLNVAEVMLTRNPEYAKAQDSAGAHYAILNNNEALLLKNIDAGAILGVRHLKAAQYVNNPRLVNIVNRVMVQTETGER